MGVQIIPETEIPRIATVGQFLIADRAGVLRSSQQWRLYEASVSAPTTVKGYLELFAVPARTAVVLEMIQTGIRIRKRYYFFTSSSFADHDIPPYDGVDPAPTSDTVVLEHIWDSANNRSIIRLRRQAGTAARTVRISALISDNYTVLSGTGASDNDKPLLGTAQRGFALVGRSTPTSNVTSVSFSSGFRVTRAAGGCLRLTLRTGNPVAATTGYHLRVNGEANSSAWTTQHCNIDGNGVSAARISGNSNIAFTVGSNGLAVADVTISFSTSDLYFVSVGEAQGGAPIGILRFGWRSGNPAEVTRVDVVSDQTNGIASGSVIELYALLER